MPKYPWLICYWPMFRLTKLAFLRGKCMMFSRPRPILQSTERFRNIFKEVPVVAFCRSPFRTVVTSSFVRNSQTATAHPASPLPAHSVATPDMAAPPAHTLAMGKHHSLSPTQEKQDKLNITLLVTQQEKM